MLLCFQLPQPTEGSIPYITLQQRRSRRKRQCNSSIRTHRLLSNHHATIAEYDDSNNNQNIQRVVDYDEEGRKLLALVHLSADEQDDPHTSGAIHVGTRWAAESLEKLNAINCRRIVYCCLDGKLEDFPVEDDTELFVDFEFKIG